VLKEKNKKTENKLLTRMKGAMPLKIAHLPCPTKEKICVNQCNLVVIFRNDHSLIRINIK